MFSHVCLSTGIFRVATQKAVQWTLAYPILGYTALGLSEQRTGLINAHLCTNISCMRATCYIAVGKERGLYCKSSCSRCPKWGKPKQAGK